MSRHAGKWLAWVYVSVGIEFTQWAKEGTLLAQRMTAKHGPATKEQIGAPTYSLEKRRVAM